MLTELRDTDPPRYRLLETLRQYGREQLEARGEAEAVRARHATSYIRLAERELRGPDRRTWLDRLEGDRDNLRAALTWLVQESDVERASRMCAALIPFWQARGYLREGRTFVELVLAVRGGDRTRSHARLLAGAGLLADYLGDHAAARSFREQG